MNQIPNRQAICESLMEAAQTDPSIVALCSDSRGSASMTPFFDRFPGQSVEVGIAEQNLVSIAAGMAHVGKRPFCFSPASFLSTRSYEQAKVDVAYSDTNVKLIGISGGVSYGALGMSHHSAQDIAAMSAIPNMRVYLPSDRFQTARLMDHLIRDDQPAYVRVGRNPVEDIYDDSYRFRMDRATVLDWEGQVLEEEEPPYEREFSQKVLVVACGEMVRPALDAAKLLKEEGIGVLVLDMYCLKPFDSQTLLRYARKVDLVLTAEEHAPFGGLGSMVASVLSANDPKRVIQLALPDDHVITGTSKEVFAYYGMNASGIAQRVLQESALL